MTSETPTRPEEAWTPEMVADGCHVEWDEPGVGSIVRDSDDADLVHFSVPTDWTDVWNPGVSPEGLVTVRGLLSTLAAVSLAEGGDVPNRPTPEVPEGMTAHALRCVAFALEVTHPWHHKVMGWAAALDPEAAAGGAVAVPPEPEDWRQCGACGWAGPESAWDDEDHAVRHDRPAVAVPEDRPPEINDEMVRAAAVALFALTAPERLWHSASGLTQAEYRDKATVVLRAALDPSTPTAGDDQP